MVAGDQVWYCALGDGTRIGPIDERELVALVKSGKLQGSDQVWKKGWPDWSPAESVQLLAIPLAVHPPPLVSYPPPRAHAPSSVPTRMRFNRVLKAIWSFVILMLIVSGMKFCMWYTTREARVPVEKQESTSSGAITLDDLKKVAAYENKKLPRGIDSITVLERIEAGPGISLTHVFKITLPGMNPDTFTPEIAENIRRDFKHTICTTSQPGLQSGISYGLRYTDLQGNVLDVFYVDHESCEG